MEQNLERPYYQDTGRRPFLFYAAIGGAADELHVSRSLHRVEELPEGLEVACLQRPEYSSYMDNLLGGSLEMILDRQNHELLKKAKAERSWLVIHGEVAQDTTLDYLRNAIGFVQASVETGAVAVLDLQSLELFSVKEWVEKIFSWKFHPCCHINAMISPNEDGTYCLHTRGMRKFGRPDIGLENVPLGELERAKAIANQIIFFSVQGAVFSRSARLHLGETEICDIHPKLTGDMEDPNYNNEHYQLFWSDLIFGREDGYENPV